MRLALLTSLFETVLNNADLSNTAMSSSERSGGRVCDRVWIFTGGDFSSDQLASINIHADDFIVCVDSGVEACLSVGLSPDLLVGDFDSASPQILKDKRLADVPRHEFPSEKASSDLELALQIVEERSPSLVTVLGVSGGRTDHMLFNWHLIARRNWTFDRQIIDDTTHTYVLEGKSEIVLQSSLDTQVSLLAINESLGVTTSGLYYPLVDARIEPGSTLGLSNIVKAEQFGVKINEGTLLVMMERKNKSGGKR